MGVPTSEVGYTSAMSRREDLEVHKDMWGIEKKNILKTCTSQINLPFLYICTHNTQLKTTVKKGDKTCITFFSKYLIMG